MTKGKRIIAPATIIECPRIKVLSVRFYKDKKILSEVMNKNLDKELKRVIKLPKNTNKKLEDFKEGDYEDIRLVVYSEVKKTSIKKTPDISEIGLSGNLNEKLEFAKNNFNKEISIKDFIKEDGMAGAPTNAVGSGAIAGTGTGPDPKSAEPPGPKHVMKRLSMMRRKPPKVA